MNKHCSLCDLSFNSVQNLEKHLTREVHFRKQRKADEMTSKNTAAKASADQWQNRCCDFLKGMLLTSRSTDESRDSLQRFLEIQWNIFSEDGICVAPYVFSDYCNDQISSSAEFSESLHRFIEANPNVEGISAFKKLILRTTHGVYSTTNENIIDLKKEVDARGKDVKATQAEESAQLEAEEKAELAAVKYKFEAKKKIMKSEHAAANEAIVFKKAVLDREPFRRENEAKDKAWQMWPDLYEDKFNTDGQRRQKPRLMRGESQVVNDAAAAAAGGLDDFGDDINGIDE